MNYKFLLIFFFFSFFYFPVSAQGYDRAVTLFNEGTEMSLQGNFPEAIEFYNEAELIFSGLSDNYNLSAFTSLWRGIAQNSLYNYSEAVADFKNSIKQAVKNDYTDVLLSAYSYLGVSYSSVDNWAEAYESFQTAFQYAVKYNGIAYYPVIYEGLGNVEYAWGKYDLAEQHYILALEYAEQQNVEDSIVKILIGFGRIEHARNNLQEAIDVYEAILLRPGIAQSKFYSSIINSIGMVNFNMGEADTALQYYEQAMVLTEQNNNMIERIQLLIHIGGAYHMLERYSDALDVYLQALPLTEKYQRIGDRSICLYNIGLAYVYLDQLEKAIQFFEESIELKEKLRLSATGQDRLDYLAAEVHVYQWLSLTHLQMDNYEQAITVIENSSAKYLKEQLQYRASTALVFPGIDAVQKNLKQDELLINYASNSTPWNSVMTISSSELDGVLLFPDDLGNQFSYNAVSEFTRLTGMYRGISLLFQEESVTEIGQMSFDDIINYYRLLLISKTNPEQLYRTGRYLYDYFIAPLESQISGHKNLTIIPDGILAFLPFETLIMPDGRYLVEEYNISYVQSLAVSEIISGRTYSEDRMDFIGFGGANYDKFSNRTKPTDYSSLNISGWNNLPGTVLEINEISSLYESSNIFQKNDLSESAIKNLSKNGTLKQYKIIHFATHGLVLPEQPELSALVLTSYGKQSEDGYLNVAEISRLDIAADFVNLSACETGLGKIYGGEGVVGLAQAFLIAGANSLSVSLWQVADQSTREFMVGFYKLITSGEFTYNHAMSEMKREFIASEQYSHPFYWAPFVFYGE